MKTMGVKLVNDNNIVSLGLPQPFPEVREMSRDLAETINRHVDKVPAVAIIGIMEIIKQDLVMQTMELGGE